MVRQRVCRVLQGKTGRGEDTGAWQNAGVQDMPALPMMVGGRERSNTAALQHVDFAADDGLIVGVEDVLLPQGAKEGVAVTGLDHRQLGDALRTHKA